MQSSFEIGQISVESKMVLKKQSAAFLTIFGIIDKVLCPCWWFHVDSSGYLCLFLRLTSGKNFLSVSGSVPYCFIASLFFWTFFECFFLLSSEIPLIIFVRNFLNVFTASLISSGVGLYFFRRIIRDGGVTDEQCWFKSLHAFWISGFFCAKMSIMFLGVFPVRL